MATHSYQASDQGAAISSGSFLTQGMVVVPCSMRTLAAIAQGQPSVFLNADSNDVNVVYRRRDGDYGLIEPQVT